MVNFIDIVILCIIVLTCNCCNGNSTTGQTIDLFCSAKSFGLAEACTSLDEDTNFIFFNPASLKTSSPEKKIGLDFMYSKLNEDANVAYELVKVKNFAFCFANYDGGMFEHINNNGDVINIVKAQEDRMLMFSLADNFNYFGFSDINIGGTIKYFDSTLVSRYNTNSVLLDLGLIKELKFGKVGIVARNISLKKMKYVNIEETLPGELRVGYSWNCFNNKGIPAIDTILPFEGQGKISFGIAYKVADWVWLRGGIKLFTKAADNISFGAGFVKDFIKIDLGMQFGILSNSLDPLIKINFSYSFLKFISADSIKSDNILVMEGKIKDLESRKEERDKENKELRSLNYNLNDKIGGLEVQINAADSTINILKNRINKGEQQKNGVIPRTELIEETTTLVRLRCEIKNLEDAKKKLNVQLRELNNEIANIVCVKLQLTGKPRNKSVKLVFKKGENIKYSSIITDINKEFSIPLQKDGAYSIFVDNEKIGILDIIKQDFTSNGNSGIMLIVK
jgi:hypothetical protein